MKANSSFISAGSKHLLFWLFAVSFFGGWLTQIQQQEYGTHFQGEKYKHSTGN